MIQALKQTSQLKLKQYLRILNSLETKRIYSLVKKQAEGNVNRSIHLRKITLKMMIVTEEKKNKLARQLKKWSQLQTANPDKNRKCENELEIHSMKKDTFQDEMKKERKKKAEMALQCMGILFKGYMGENNTG